MGIVIANPLLLTLGAATGTPYSETSATPGETNLGAGYTMFCRSFAIDNGATITSIGAYSNTAGTMRLKIALRNSATSYTIVVDEAVSHGGGGWQDFTLGTPYVIPGSGTYHAGFYQNIGTISSIASLARTYKLGDVGLTTDTGMAEDTNSGPAVRVSGTI